MKMLELAERLTSEVGNGIPIDLGRLALSRAIKSIEFRPLLVDGGLSVVEDGFHIFVRCESARSKHFTALFSEDGTGRRLPASVAKRIRFTVAHEIAHTFLFDITTSPPSPQFETGNGQNLRSLEHACNDVAGALLLPEQSLRLEFPDLHKLLDPNALRTFGDRALVSRPNLVVRLAHLEHLTLPIGVIASARESQDGWLVTAITCHYSLKELFSNVRIGGPVQALLGKDSGTLVSDCGMRGILNLADHSFEFLVEAGSHRGMKGSRIITLRRI